MQLLNLNTLVKVEAFDKRHNHRYEWRSEKSWFFGLSKRKAGFYYAFYINEELAYDMEQAQKQYIVEDNLLYDKPCVKLKFANSSCDIFEEYDTLEQAHARCEEVKALAINSVWLKT